MKLNRRTWKTYAFWILLSELVGAISGWLTRGNLAQYSSMLAKPPLSPPGILFPIVWTILFALMGVGAARIYMTPASTARSRSLLLFLTQLLVNFFWSIIFFNLHAIGFAFLWIVLLWILVFWMFLSFRKIDRIAAQLHIPYLIWLTFAAYLNLGIWYLNWVNVGQVSFGPTLLYPSNIERTIKIC